MRKFVFYGCIVLSACIGVVVGAHASWGLAVFIGLQFALLGLALGGLLNFFWSELMDRKRSKVEHEHDEEWEPSVIPIPDGSVTSPEEMDGNLWAATGHHPIANPEYLEDIRRSDELLRHAGGAQGLPPMVDRDDFDPGR